MEFAEIKKHIKKLDFLKVSNCITFTGEDYLKELKTLLKQRDEILEMLKMEIDSLDLSNFDFYEKYGFNVSELKYKQRQLIKEVTEI